MDGILRDAARYDQLESLIKQRRYDESIALLDDIIAKTPQDSDAYLYRSLVTRIVALREFCQNQQGRLGASFSASFKPKVAESPTSTAPNRQPRKHWRFGPTRGSAHDWGFRCALAVAVVSIAAIVTVIGADLLLGTNRRLTASTQAPGGGEMASVPKDRSIAGGGQLIRAVGETENKAQPQPPTLGDKQPEIAKTEVAPEREKPAAAAAAKPKKKKLKSANRPKPNAEDLADPPARSVKEFHASANNPLYYKARRPITIRQTARFAAPAVVKLSEGALVQVIDVRNSWARVQLEGKAPGFVRIEYLGPVEMPTPRSESLARLGMR